MSQVFAVLNKFFHQLGFRVAPQFIHEVKVVEGRVHVYKIPNKSQHRVIE